MYYILLDACFWISYLEPQDNPKLSLEANRIFKDFENETLVIPFPTLYEFVNSKLSRSKNKDGRDLFERVLNTKKIEKIADEEYKEIALINFFKNSSFGISDISLVDEVIKLIIDDPNYKIDYIATFDEALQKFARSRNVYLP